MQLRWTASLLIGAAVLALVPTGVGAERPKQRGKWEPTGAVALGGVPLCPVALSRKAPTKPVQAGRKLSTRVQVINTGATPLDALTVQVGLPSNVCAYKTEVSPRVLSKAEANITDQNVYWLSTLIGPGKDRTFTIRATVSPLLPSGPVTISTLVYVQDANGAMVCASGLPDATVEIRNKRSVNKRDIGSRRAYECPRPQAGSRAHFITAHDQRLMYGRLAIATAATPDLCHLACSDPNLHKLFYFTITASGECYCAETATPEVVWDPTATTYEATLPHDASAPKTWMRELVRLRVQSFAEQQIKSAAAGAAAAGVAAADVAAADAAVMDDAEDRVDAQIVGGVVAPPRLMPFLVGLLQATVTSDYNAQFCGGTLYNQRYVITAAHCVDFITSPSQVAILVGTQTLSQTSVSQGRRIGVSRVTINPAWNPTTFNYDVAIIELATAVTDIPFAQLAPRGSDPVTGAKSTVSGWGTTSSGGSSPVQLRTVVVPNWDRTTCNQGASYNGQITSAMFCAGETGKDSCQGDSGGPITNNDNTTLIGIVSWGEGCALALKPGVYTRVGNTAIHDFIAQTASLVPTVTPPPTRTPTRMPTVLGQGHCALPYPLRLGTNSFNNAPASGLRISTSGTSCNFGATGYAASYNSVYYQFIPQQTGTYTFSTCSTANFDTKILVSTTCSVAQAVTCNDDGANCNGYTSITPAVTLTADTPYYVIIGGWSANTPAGSGTITVTGPPPTRSPTPTPTREPTRTPTTSPPTRAPTAPPPTNRPTNRPTIRPTLRPTPRPTLRPTARPPTRPPTRRPTRAPTRRFFT